MMPSLSILSLLQAELQWHHYHKYFWFNTCWAGQGKWPSVEISLEYLPSHSRESARQERAVCAVRVKNNLDSTAILSPLKWVEDFKLGQSRVYIMAYVRNTLSFVQTASALPFSSSLFLQATGMANNFTSALELINWVETAASHRWNQLKLEAMKQWSATAHVVLSEWELQHCPVHDE